MQHPRSAIIAALNVWRRYQPKKDGNRPRAAIQRTKPARQSNGRKRLGDSAIDGRKPFGRWWKILPTRSAGSTGSFATFTSTGERKGSWAKGSISLVCPISWYPCGRFNFKTFSIPGGQI